MVSPEETKLGGVETHADARLCADLFKRHRDEIDGVLVVLPNFGDEKGVADVLKLAELDVPVLVQGYPDDLNQLGVVAAARCVLRQDFGLQQPGAGGHQVLAHRRSTSRIRLRTASAPISIDSCGSAAW